MAFKIFSVIRARFFNQASDTAVELGLNGEEQPRLKIDAGGRLSWGAGGASTPDTNLYRDEANVLKTDDTLKVPSLFVNSIEIDTTGAQQDYVFVYNESKFSAASVIPESALPPIAQTLTDLTDVTVTSVVDDQVLVYDTDTDQWVNRNLSEITEIVQSINDLNDAAINSPLNGQVLEYNGTGWVNATSVTSEPMGFVNRTASVISFNNSTRQLSITPASTSYEIWCKGIRFVKTGTETTTIPDTSGLYFVYYNSAGVLSNRLGFFDFADETPVAYVYWNATDGVQYFFADERHGVVLDWATHEYLHRTRGAAFANGFGIGNYTTTGTGTSDSDMQLDISNGTFFDEDLKVEIVHSATPIANTWEQILQGGAEIPILYHDGAVWKRTTPTKFPVKQGTLPQYNLLNGGTWSATDLATDTFGVTWIIATNNLNYPIVGILGQKQYANINKVAEDSWGSLFLDGLPVVELRPLYKIAYLVSSTFTNTPKAAIRQVIDIRSDISGGSGLSATPIDDHGSLLGLSDDDHLQYVHVDIARTVSATHTFTNGLSAGYISVTGSSGSTLIDVVTATLSSTSENQNLDSTQGVSAKYIVHADNGVNSETVEILALRKETTVNHVEYGHIGTGTSYLAEYSVSQNAGNILLNVSPTSPDTTFTVFKTVINQ
jgi:hypothetical protein